MPDRACSSDSDDFITIISGYAGDSDYSRIMAISLILAIVAGIYLSCFWVGFSTGRF